MRPARVPLLLSVVFIAGWLVAGWLISGTAGGLTFLGTNARYAQTAAAACPLFFVLLSTGMGLAGSAKWWRTDVSSNIVLLEVAAVCTAGILAWSFLFHNGSLNTFWLAWLYEGGLWAGAIIITWRSVIWLRAERQARRATLDDQIAAVEERLASLQARKAAQHQ